MKSAVRWIKPFLAISLTFAQAAMAAAPPSIDDTLRRYRDDRGQAVFVNQVNHLPSSDRDLVYRLMDGIYFIDFGHAAPELLEMFMGKKKLAEMKFPNMYDGPGQPSLKAFSDARRFLAKVRKPLTLDLIQEIHAMVLPWSNEFNEGPRVFRRRFVYGPEFKDGLYPVQIQSINQNPYLYFLPSTNVFADVPQDVDKAKNGERTRGAIVYPRPRDIKREALNRLQNSRPDLVQRVLQYQAQYGQEYTNKSEDLTNELVKALLQERIDTFEAEQKALGDLSRKGAVEKYVRLVADFQRDFVSIHPFPDGNGRTSRLLLYYLAERKNLPAPRIVYPNEDLFWTPDMWAGEIKNGMMASVQLQAALIDQMEKKLPVEKSVALLTPTLPAEQDLKTYETFFRTRLASENTLSTNISKDAAGTMRALRSEYKPQAAGAR